jgi:TPR repeat protein
VHQTAAAPSPESRARRLADAQYNLGICYALGKGVKKDETKAAQLYGQAAEQDDADAQFNFGVCYELGSGVEKDEAKSAQLYGQAAKQGNVNAQFSLGGCYTLGKGVKEDKAKAARLYGQAAHGCAAGPTPRTRRAVCCCAGAHQARSVQAQPRG